MQRARNILSSAPFLIPLVSGSSPSFLYILRIPLRSEFPMFPVRFTSLRYSAYDSRILPAPSLRLLCHYPFPALHLRFASAFPCAFLISAYSGFPHFPYLAFPDFPYSTVYLVYKPVAKYPVDRLNINMDKPSC